MASLTRARGFLRVWAALGGPWSCLRHGGYCSRGAPALGAEACGAHSAPRSICGVSGDWPGPSEEHPGGGL